MIQVSFRFTARERVREKEKRQTMREISIMGCVHMDFCSVCRNRWRVCSEPCGELRCIVLLGREIKICDWKTLRLLESLDI